MLDKKQIQAIFLSTKWVIKQQRQLTSTFGPGTATECVMQWWFKKFCKGDETREDEECSGWSSEVDNYQLREYTEELYKKDLNDPDNHDGVITHLESDILECEVKWVSGGITMNKASGSDGIPAELFQILKGDAVKVLYSIRQ